ncbi:BTAD domain-containing putative transcriptional regulator [Kitasatospora sp. NPDC007106]|uniref:BTAD domain-containing putative transcriptional regulator n=1 Tax=Kitasatospora sp. NPDC007106 TaxID=3156914 RepID=UPI0033FB2933
MVRISVLGTLTAQVAGATVGLGGPRQRGVLARLLVARGAVVPVDRLIDDLWQGRPPAKAAASLQAYVSNLRRLLEPERGPREPARLLVSRAPGYALAVPASGVDAWDFEQRLRDARDLRPFAEQAAERLGHPVSRLFDEALALWRGTAFAEFADEPWAAAEITRLGELRLAARESAVVAALDEGRAGEAAAAALALTEEHPLREEGWRLLARALWGAGRQAEALEALRRARTVLTAELGLDPGPALAELESAILRQRTDLLAVPTPAADLPPARPSGPACTAGPGCGGGPPEPPFVGREAEQRTLREAATAATAPGGRSVVLVSGEAGAGKSTLLARLSGELRRSGWLVATGRCPETEGAPPAWAWTEALRELARQHPPSAATAAELAPLLGEDDPSRRRDALTGRFRLHRAVVRWLEAATEQAPVAVILDDLHAADQETRALAAELAAALGPERLMLVCAHRPGEGRLTDLLGTFARCSPYRIALGGLDEAEAGTLIGAVCDTPVDADTVRALAERTGGNPFYLVESAHLLAGEGALVAVQEVPQGVRDVLRRRFDRLPPATVEALRLASVAGRETEVELLVHASGAEEEGLLDALEAAVAGGLLTEPRPGAVRFAHALVRDTLYGDLSGLRRARLHGRFAEALCALRPDRLAALAHHWTAAASSATAQRAVDACVRAAEAAERRYAHQTCADLLQQALDNLDRVPEDGDDRPARRIALLGALLRAQVRAGAISAATATRSRAVALAEETGREDLEIEAWTAWTEPTPWVAHPYGSYDDRAVETLQRLLRRTDLPPATRCRLLDALTHECNCAGEPIGTAAADEALAIARAEGDPRLLALALAASARICDFELGAPQRAVIADELAALARRHDLPAYRWQAEQLYATAAAVAGDLPALRRHIAAAAAIAERYGLLELVDVGRCHRGMLELAAGRTAEAAELYRQAVAGLTARASVHAEGFGALADLTIAVQEGRIGSELPRLRAVTALYGRLVADVEALALAALGRTEEARAARAVRPPVQPDYYRSFFLALRAAAVVALDERAEAAELIAELRPLRGLVAGAASTSVALRPVAQSLGELARMLGRTEEAAGYFAQAAEVARRWESPRWEAEALAALHGLPAVPDAEAVARHQVGSKRHPAG